MDATLTQDMQAAWEVPTFTTREFAARNSDYCVVIPVINEGERIHALLSRMHALRIADQADIILIDGGTTDGSLEENAVRGFGVRALLLKTGPGKLSAQLRCAYAYALKEGYAGIVTIDGNNKDDPDTIPNFIAELKRGTDFAQASRFVAGGAAENTPWIRDVAIRLIHAPALNFASGFHWTDTTQGYRAYSRKLLLHPDIQPFRAVFARYELLAFLSYQAPRLGLVCKELATTRRYPKDGKVPTKISAVRGNIDLMSTLLNACCGRYNPPEQTRLAAPRPWPGIAHILMGLVLALAMARVTWSASESLTHQKYPEPVAGSIAWRDANKESDFRALFALLAVSALLPWLLKALTHAAGRGRPKVCDTLEKGLLLSVVPAAMFLAARAWGFGRINLNAFESAPYVALPASMLVLCALLLRRRSECVEDDAKALVSAVLTLPMLMLFGGLGLRVFVSHYGPERPWLESLGEYGAPHTTLSAALLALLIAGVFSSTAEVLRRRLFALIAFAQLPVPLLFFSAIPTTITRAAGAPAFRNECGPALKWVVMGVVLCAWLAWVWRMWRARESFKTDVVLPKMNAILVPLCVAAIPCFLQTFLFSLPVFRADQFHAGEEFLPWDQLWNHGKLPYVEFAPIHPGPDLLSGLLRQLFFDGTSASYYGSYNLEQAILAVATFYAARACAGTQKALAAVFFCTIAGSQVACLPAGLFILAIPGLLKRPVAWLAVWFVLCPLMVLYNPSVGFAFTVGTAPVALWQFWHAVEKSWRPLLPLAVGTGIAALFILSVPPLREMAFGFMRFLTENQATSTVAHGSELNMGTYGGDWGGRVSSALGFELLRSSWVWIPCGMVWLTGRELSRPARASGPLIALAIMAAATACMIGFWSFGRIDPGAMSRTGVTSMIFFFNIIPLVLLLRQSSVTANAGLVALAVLCGVFNCPLGDVERLVFKADFRRTITANDSVIDGAALGVPKLGMLNDSPEKIAELLALKNTLREFLKPDETYFDFSNNQGYYYYLNLPTPVLYPATFNAANSTMQKRMLKQLQASNPPVVLVSPGTRFDATPPGLRNYLLYREYVLKFAAVRRPPFLMLVDPARLHTPIQETEQQALLNEAFLQADLGKLPSSWGKSWSSLSSSFVEVRTIESGASDAPIYTIAAPALSGRDFDMVRLEFDFDAIPGHEPVVEIAWKSERPGSLRFTCTQKGSFLIPLAAAAPNFLLSKSIASISVKQLTPGENARAQFGRLSLLKLKARD